MIHYEISWRLWISIWDCIADTFDFGAIVNMCSAKAQLQLRNMLGDMQSRGKMARGCLLPSPRKTMPSLVPVQAQSTRPTASPSAIPRWHSPWWTSSGYGQIVVGLATWVCRPIPRRSKGSKPQKKRRLWRWRQNEADRRTLLVEEVIIKAEVGLHGRMPLDVNNE